VLVKRWWFSPPSPADIAMAMAGVLAVATLWIVQLMHASPFRVDDAFITFSFSKNLAAGNGPIFSHGVRVEGYSNFLWMVLNAIPMALGRRADPYLSARLLATPFLVLLFLGTYRLARARVGRVWAFAAVLLTAAHSDLMSAFLSGLETVPYTALVTAAFACQTARRGTWLRRAALPCATVAALTRIDGFIPLGFLLVWELLETRWDRRRLGDGYLRSALPCVAIWAAWFTWRFWYYGLPLPTTYYAKALLPVLDPQRGWDYAYEEFRTTGVAVMLPFLVLLAHRRVRAVWMLILYGALHVVYVIRVGGDWMPFGRFFIPIVPLAAVLCTWAAADLVVRARGIVRRRRALQVAATLAGLAALGGIGVFGNHRWPNTDRTKAERIAYLPDNAAHVRRLQHIAELLRLVVPSGARLVTDFAGVLAYETDAHIIDMWGLCNAAIATRGNARTVRPMYGRTCHFCYVELRPEYFHVEIPFLRSPDAFDSHQAVVDAVWQANDIGKYIDIVGGFRTGRLVDHRSQMALFFLERRTPFVPARTLPEWASVDYPFGE
jgi:arabinofuranosyltransferase